jgi:DNA-binding NarL/FixJ family response regulator
MTTIRSRYGGPIRVLIVAAPATLLQRMVEVVQSLEGTELAGGFSTVDDALEWSVWERKPWHFAYVDMTLPEQKGEQLARHLLQSPRAGTVVGLCAHLWRETREKLGQIGVADILEKADFTAFQGDLERRLG